MPVKKEAGFGDSSHRSVLVTVIIVAAVILAAAAVLSVLYAYYGMPGAPGRISVEIPDYTVEASAGYDYADIEGGQVLYEEEGRPRIPYYIKAVDYPEGYRIQNVTISGISGIKTETGLNLPMIILNPNIDTAPAMIKGRYPATDFTWYETENNDGTTTLFIKIYPFVYVPETKTAIFSKNFKFYIQFIRSNIKIMSFNIVGDMQRKGEIIKFDIVLENEGKSFDAVLLPSIREAGADAYAAALEYLPQCSLNDLSGTSSAQISWDSSKYPAGSYCADIILMDAYGNIHSRATAGFTITQ